MYKTYAFDATAPDITLTIPLAGDYWSYTSIMPMTLHTNASNTQYLRAAAARSALETLGVQRRGDTTPPVAQAKLIDRKSGAVLAE